jgi:hypothetical protein
MRDGEELFCKSELQGHFVREACYTRSEAEERERIAVLARVPKDGASGGGLSMSPAYGPNTASGH